MVKLGRGSYGKLMCGTFIISKVPADVARWFGTTCTIITTTPVFRRAILALTQSRCRQLRVVVRRL